jgi:signal transduction histidine kinase/CheY-like chemotaxis protein
MTAYTHFDHLLEPVLVLNLKGEIVYFNNQSSIFFKMPPRVLKTKNHLLQLCDSTDFNLEDWLNKSALSFDIQLSPEIKMHLPHDPETEYSVVLKLIPIESSFALQIQDKTVERNLHLKYREQLEELKKTHSQILQADKLTTLGELTANISHEINNPLTIASGNCEIIRDYLMMPAPMQKLAQIQSANDSVIESLERVNQIIKNMKDFLHQSEDQKEFCDLDSLLETAVEWIQPTANKANVKIEKIHEGNRKVALANRIKLEQVVINLVKNSIDALKEMGIPDPLITLRLARSEKENHTYIDIIDNGPGLPESIKANLFKPFQSTKESGTGTGLGLSICAKIIETHKGRLEYIPSQSGCHFRIRLPLIEIYSYTRNNRSLSAPKSQKRILVLDNEVQILNVLNSFLQEDNYIFIGSSDPQDALGFLSKANVDLIITDFSMPIMNGAQFTRFAREQGYEGPILYMTSPKYIEQYNKDKLELDIGGVIVKPFNKDDVMKTIRHALKSKEGAA